MEEERNNICCPWCKCEMCEALCLKFCCCCCKGQARDASRKHPHILYGQLHQQHDTKQTYRDQQSTSDCLPIKRRYKYPQKYCEYNIPPQLGGKHEEVTEQPHKTSRSPSTYGIAQDTIPLQLGGKDHDDEVFGSVDHATAVDTMEAGAGDRPVRFAVIERSPEAALEHLIISSSKKTLDLQIMPPDASEIGKVNTEMSPSISGVHFTLYYNELESMLIIHIIQAVDLPTQRPEYTSIPFLQVYLLPSKVEVQQSHCVDNTHSPEFDCVFGFHIPFDNLRRHMVVMRFYINVNHFVGGVLYSLREGDLMGNKIVKEITEFDEEEGLKESCQGDILLTMCYHTMTDVLTVLVLEVSNLKRYEHVLLPITPDPYVKINLLHHGQRMSKWKTSIKKSTTNPVFNETCKMDISTMNIEDIQLDVVVVKYDQFGHNTEIGSVSFGDIASHKSGQGHWKRIMIETNSEISRWHPLVPSSHSESRSPSSAPTIFRRLSPFGLQL